MSDFRNRTGLARTLSIVTGVLCLFSALKHESRGDPTTGLGNGGVRCWITSDPRPVILHSINDGTQVMVLWRENSPVDPNYHLVGMIYNSDGSNARQEPLILSFPWGLIYGIKSTPVSDGSLLLVWYYMEVEAPLMHYVYVQKIDPSGELRWGEYGTLVAEFNSLGLSPVEQLFSDDHGGCYLETLSGIIALDEDGNRREEWQWHEQDPDTPNQATVLLTDGAGGFWYSVYDEINRLDLGWNKVNYRGERLLDSPQRTADFVMPTRYWGLLEGLDGAVLCRYKGMGNPSDTLGYFRMDPDGNYSGDRYLHRFPVARGSNHIRYSWKLSGGKVLMSDANASNPILYDWANNRTPWGVSGIRLGLSGDLTPQKPMEEANGDLLLLNRVKSTQPVPNQFVQLSRIRPDGTIPWGRAIEDIFPLGSAHYPHGGFWIAGQKTNGYFERPVYILNRYDNSGIPVWDDFVTLPIENRNRMDSPRIWFHQSRYHILFSQYAQGIYRLTLSAGGEVIGNPGGTMVHRTDSLHLSYDYNISSLALDERILYVYTPDNYDSLYRPKLLSFGLDGALQWETTLSDSIPDYWGKPLIIASPDQNLAVVLLSHRAAGGARSDSRSFVVGVSLDNGEIRWRSDTPGLIRSGGSYSYDNLICDLETFYTVSYRSSDSLRIMRWDYAGNPVWEAPFCRKEYNVVFGAEVDIAGDIRVAKWFMNVISPDTVSYWVNRITADGESDDDSIFAFNQTCIFSRNYSSYIKDIKLVRSGRNLWILPNNTYGLQNNYGIQCIAEDGERLLGDAGWRPLTREGNPTGNCIGIPDDEEGLWLIWRNSVQDSVTAQVVHFDIAGRILPGWSNYGLQVLERRRSYTGPTIFASPLSNGAIALTDGTNLQYVGEYMPPIQSVNAPEVPARGFEIVSMYPQPFNDRVIVRYRGASKGELKIRLYDIRGRAVREESHTIGARQSGVITLDFASQPAGVYFVQFGDEDTKCVRKVTLLK